jgi:hypothetical protein
VASLVVPSGWGEIFNSTNVDRTTIYTRISVGTETSPITITSTASVASAYHAWRVTDTSGDVFVVPPATATSTAPDPPVNNIGGPALPYLWFAIAASNGAACNAFPADYSNSASVLGSGVVECRAERKLETSSENPPPFGLTGSTGWLALTLAIEPMEQPTEDMTLIWVLLVAFGVALLIGLRSSPFFLILAGLLLLILTVVVDADILSSQPDLVRYGAFVVLVIMSLLLFVQGALNLPDEFKGGGWKLGGR